jgi:hypothetical protein
VSRMKSMFGYNEQSARDTLERVGRLFATEPMVTKITWPYPY